MRPAHMYLTVSEIYPKVCWYGVSHRKRVCSGFVDLQILAQMVIYLSGSCTRYKIWASN